MTDTEALNFVRELGGSINFGVRVIPDAKRPKKTLPGVQVHLAACDTAGAAPTLSRAVELAREAAQKKLAALRSKIE